MKHIPNILTILRFLLVPVFIIYILKNTPYGYFYGTLIFLIASATDWLDGFLARKLNSVSNFGKIADPLADKVIVQAALFLLWHLNYAPLAVGLIVLLREILVSYLRYNCSKKDIIVAANIWGKVKTFAQMVGISAALIYITTISFYSEYTFNYAVISFRIYFWLIAVVTILSGISYIGKKR